mmetsp:Transcript_26339/g.58317  ORF Transcript_26339/g.58317 Transcript_26339/m.58317 type:complete len:145 (-) Transcript_26339:66-500(-)
MGLDGCGAVTEASMDLLVHNCRDLGSLRVTGILEPKGQLTIGVSEEWARALPQACPQLRYFLVGRYSWGSGAFKVKDVDDYTSADNESDGTMSEGVSDDDDVEGEFDADVDADVDAGIDDVEDEGEGEGEGEGDEDQDEFEDEM